MQFSRGIRLHIERRGTSIRWIRRRGDVCPCIEGALSGNRPDRGWHEANPTEPDCGGLGIVNVTETRTDFKAIFCRPREVSDWELMIVGQYQESDHVLVTAPTVGLDDFDKATDEIVANDTVFSLAWVLPYRDGDTVLFLYGLARETEGKEPTAMGA